MSCCRLAKGPLQVALKVGSCNIGNLLPPHRHTRCLRAKRHFAYLKMDLCIQTHQVMPRSAEQGGFKLSDAGGAVAEAVKVGVSCVRHQQHVDQLPMQCSDTASIRNHSCAGRKRLFEPHATLGANAEEGDSTFADTA